MEKENQDRIAEIRQTMPQKGSQASVVLNGIGNGMMIGTFPFVAAESYAHIFKKKNELAGVLEKRELPTPLYVANAFAMVAGSAVGAWYGAQEAKRLQHYRQSLVDEVTNMRGQVNQNCEQLDTWADKVQDDATQSKGPSR